jgi:hypothetical protein
MNIMAKIATDQEIAGIINDIVQQAPGQDDNRYRVFLETIAEAVGAYHAVEIGTISPPGQDLPHWWVAVQATVDTRCDGGPFAQIDTDVTIEEWREEIAATETAE